MIKQKKLYRAKKVAYSHYLTYPAIFPCEGELQKTRDFNEEF